MDEVSSPPTGADHAADRAVLREEELKVPGAGSGLELEYPARVVATDRLAHIPIVFWIVEALRPSTIVELGVGSGNSYFACVQAACRLGLDVRCVGVDQWVGDKGREFFQDVSNYNDLLYRGFSTLLQAPFEQAASGFADGTVDLLQIDAARSHDLLSDAFVSWLPKMSPRGIAVFHNVNLPDSEGVSRIWEEIGSRYPTLDFRYAEGLGIAYLGTGTPPASLAMLLGKAASGARSRVQAYFARLGTSMQQHFALRDSECGNTASDSQSLVFQAKLAHEMHARSGVEAALRAAQARVAEAAADRDRKVQILRQQMAVVRRLQRENQKVSEQVQHMYASTSWRLTAPLRVLASRIHDFRRRGRG